MRSVSERLLFGPLWGVARKLLTMLLTLLLLLTLTFLLSRMAPIDPVLQVAGDHASQQTYAQVSHELGLDQPLPLQLGRYLLRLLHGDLGVSSTTAQPVASDLARAFPATLELATYAIVLASVCGVALALLSALKPGGWLDNLVRCFSLLGYSVPVFWLGLLGLLLFYARLHWAGGPGQLDDAYLYSLNERSGFILLDSWRSGDAEILRNAVSHLWLPVLLLAMLSMAGITRLLRAALLEECGKEYVTLARAKGAGRWRILWRHVLPNVSGTLVTVLALSYSSLLEGAVLTETVFAWPGIGRYLTTALFASDVAAILGATLVIGSSFVLLNMLADSLVLLLDPRSRQADIAHPSSR
ncbi:dipeptide transport system permease protein DppB [Aquitalea magnusonii]|uniref:Dipeptide transport system permease protein DppB n=1 Tax=Aquitalea magnusonii TaxID=332411 RepID=A0A3G9GHN7_9NEIS|nr:ABC transporter permease [Aquitalea magnusonii]BBF85016.1 dipeptide transport system permease protein DppB [Aquitalea magnusonii]